MKERSERGKRVSQEDLGGGRMEHIQVKGTTGAKAMRWGMVHFLIEQ